MTALAPHLEWLESAACKGKDPRHWFPVAPGESYKRAKGPRLDPYAFARSVCRACPVVEPCRDYGLAMAREQTLHGMFGALDEHERLAILGRNRPARRRAS